MSRPAPPPRILVVEHEPDAGIGLVGERLAHAGAELVVVGPETGHAVPHSAAAYDGVVVLGGSPSPTDETVGWFPDVLALIRDCLDRAAPLLGICLGAQLLGLAAGGRTGLVRGGPEVGLCPIRRTEAADDDPLLGDLPQVTQALQWHSYEVAELPADSVALVSSDRCVNQAFRVSPFAWGLQFHLEALGDTPAAWAVGHDADLAGAGLTEATLTAQMRAAEPDLRATWAPVADRWLGLVADRRR